MSKQCQIWGSLSLLLLAMLQVGCAGFGSKTVRPARFHYNQAINESLQEQMLLNLVRIRLDEPPFFMSVGSVVTQYNFHASLGASGSAGAAGAYTVGGSTGAGFSESPTIAYQPLEDAAFAERLLSPLSPNLLVLLSHSGWEIGELMRLTLQKMNGLSNLPVAPTQQLEGLERYQAFSHVTTLFGELDATGTIAHRISNNGKDAAVYMFYFEVPHNEQEAEHIRRAKEILQLNPDQEGYPMVDSSGLIEPDKLSVETRSLLGVMTYLSHGVDTPANMQQDELDHDFRVLNKNFRIHRSAKSPRDAYLAVEHRGDWYYIAENDRETKRTFALLLYLFSVQAATEQTNGGGLLLTLPAGR